MRVMIHSFRLFHVLLHISWNLLISYVAVMASVIVMVIYMCMSFKC